MAAHLEALVLSVQAQHLQERTVRSASLLQAPVLPPDAARAPCFESLFDPVELLGTSIPFVDPFSYDDREFHASEFFFSERPHAQTLISRPIRASPHYPALLSQDLQCTAVLERDRSPVLQRTPSVPPAGPGAFPETQAGSGAMTERIRPTSDQAVHIFFLGKTKTVGTAAELASKYGISAKAIRDIWTKKSWSQDTRPHWTD